MKIPSSRSASSAQKATAELVARERGERDPLDHEGVVEQARVKLEAAQTQTNGSAEVSSRCFGETKVSLALGTIAAVVGAMGLVALFQPNTKDDGAPVVTKAGQPSTSATSASLASKESEKPAGLPANSALSSSASAPLDNKPALFPEIKKTDAEKPAIRQGQPTADIVSDVRTGLMWTSKDNGLMSWESANRYCKSDPWPIQRLATTDERAAHRDL